MNKPKIINLVLPILFTLGACSPINSTDQTNASPNPSSSTPNTSVNTTVDLSSSLKTKADFIKAYQCVIDNSSVNEDRRTMAKTHLIVVNALPEYAFTATTTASYITFLKDFDLTRCGVNSTPSTPNITPVNNGNYSTYSCDAEGTLKSSTGKAINVNFVNNTNKPINIYWLDMSGKRVNYKKGLANQAKHPQPTFVTHPWLITDANDVCMGIYTFNESQDINITGDFSQAPTNNNSTPVSSGANGSTVNVGTTNLLSATDNLARLPGVIVNVSSEFSATWAKSRLIDGNLNTSWFTAVNDAANLGKSPYIEVIFPQPVNIKGVNLKGNREYQNGYDIFEGILIVNSQSGSSSYNVKFPEPNRDFDISFNQNINSVNSIKFQITKDESVDPGLAEFEVVAAN